ncbi:O-antigen ligase family protein [Cerasicoccus frondis]|uniref:O-antigen ligase family protein n=1 Tax=Cerasicoccus frondis TaxID=490090 RepID=UPI0028529C23|nr:O-antigen ligase family protein [Cerasicoccus frondis]
MIAGLLLAVLLGWQAGTGSLGVTLLFTAGLAYVVIVSVTRCHWEAPFMAMLIVGYLVGNRGFAQLMPGGLPLLPGEAGVMVAVIALALRIPLERDLPFRFNAVTGFLLLWILTSSVHMLFDLPRMGFTAVRDFAMVYYAVIFFAGLSLARNARSLQVLEIGIAVGFYLSCIGYVIFLLRPDWFSLITYRGSPIIWYKGDLMGIFAAAGIFYFYVLSLRFRHPAAKAFLLLGMGACAGALFLSLARSAIVGAAVGVVIMVLAGHWRIVPKLIIVGILGAGMVIGADLLRENRLTESPLYAAFEHGVSLVDVTGRYDYQNPDSVDTGDNNRFRLVWWRSLTQHVFEHGPVFGLGFGYNLANPFVQEYFPTGNDRFSARSPHNFMLTVFGRTGLVGVACLGLLFLFLGGQLIRMVIRQKAKEPIARPLLYTTMALVIFIGALFQVVLEGPMGAVLFWLFLGLGQGCWMQVQEEAQDESAE